jgi:putative acetyltransferase
MYRITRTNSENQDFSKLVEELDKDLAVRDGKDHAFYHQFNKIDAIKYVVIAYDEETPVGCGAIKHYEDQVMEVKRMYVKPAKRGKGIASLILKELENWTKELNYKKCILETGIKQPEAIQLYKKSDYTVIANYGQYTGVKNSVCFEKLL